jgi:hypothetical protein
LPAYALLTDVGNDILYGVRPERLLSWVELCLDQLAAAGAATVVTELPLGSVSRLGAARFQFFRRAMFPWSRMSLEEVKRISATVNEGLVELARARNFSVISACDAWYGIDPIHLKRRAQRRAWPAILSSWRANEEPVVAPRATLWERAYLACLAPHQRSVMGIPRRCAQPSGHLRDGTTISLF